MCGGCNRREVKQREGERKGKMLGKCRKKKREGGEGLATEVPAVLRPQTDLHSGKVRSNYHLIVLHSSLFPSTLFYLPSQYFSHLQSPLPTLPCCPLFKLSLSAHFNQKLKLKRAEERH